MAATAGRAAACALALLVAGCGAPDDPGASAFHRALEASNAATREANRFTTTLDTPTATDLALIAGHARDALAAARAVPDGTLAAMHPRMPDKFRGEFEPALESIVAAIDDRDRDRLADGYWRLDQWAAWLEATADDINFPRKPAA